MGYYVQSTQGKVVGRQDAIDGEVDLKLGQLHDEVLFEEEAFQLGLASLDAGVRHQHTRRGLSSGEARETTITITVVTRARRTGRATLRRRT